MRKVLVTGAGGFVARALMPELRRRDWFVLAATRRGTVVAANETVETGDLCTTRWDQLLRSVDSVVHLAARVHVTAETVAPDEARRQFFSVNELATARLAEAALAAGVRRFVFLSTIKVNGEGTTTAPIDEGSPERPVDAYAESKLAAERRLKEIAARGLEVVTIRPCLVFGAEVRANFLRLLQFVDRGIPLPFGSVENRRSLISAWNLADLVCSALEHRQPPPLLIAAEDPAFSTPALIGRLAELMNRPKRVYRFPVRLLRVAGTILGLQEQLDRLCGSLEVDASLARRSLDWKPPLSLEEGLRRTVQWYLEAGHGRR